MINENNLSQLNFYERVQKISDVGIYSLGKIEKDNVFVPLMIELTHHHLEKCEIYRRIVKGIHYKVQLNKLEDIPFIPVRLFKLVELLSIKREDIFKTLSSSGTSGQSVSKIYLDRNNAAIQSKVLVSIMVDLMGGKGCPC